MNTREARQIAGSIAVRTKTTRRARLGETRTLLALIERLCAALDEERQRENYTIAYVALAEDWNGVCAMMRELGIEATQPMHSGAWHWRYGDQLGAAPTTAQAWRAALLAAGARPAPARPTAPALALDPPRLCGHCGLPLLNGSILDETIIARQGRQMTVHGACAELLAAEGWGAVAQARGLERNSRE